MTIPARASCPWSVVSKPNFDMWSSIQDAKPLPPADVMWSSIQDAKPLPPADVTGSTPPPQPYVHPMMKRSTSSLSQKSLEVCTESLGSETGSDGGCFSDFLDDCFSASSFSSSAFSSPAPSVVAGGDEEGEEEYNYDQQEHDDDDDGEDDEGAGVVKKELLSVNYHCSLGRRPLTRSFPPPLPSISRRDGPCIQMRSYRRDGRLVLKAVPVPSQNYLHCRRGGGRLLLTFIEPAFEEVYPVEVARQMLDLMTEPKQTTPRARREKRKTWAPEFYLPACLCQPTTS